MNRWFRWIILILVAAGVVMMVMAITNNDNTPAWSEDSGKFLKHIGQALASYSISHNGHLPDSLDALYPHYIHDKRVSQSIAMFSNRKMAIVYWKPSGLGNPDTPVVQLILDPSAKTDYPWRSLVLWGDGMVRLQ